MGLHLGLIRLSGLGFRVYIYIYIYMFVFRVMGFYGCRKLRVKC